MCFVFTYYLIETYCKSCYKNLCAGVVSGMSKDADIMIQLYKMAADQGHVQASTRLQALQT